MRTPDFYDEAPCITMFDPLAKFLGAAEGGILEYRYLDAVKLAGHSCPTVDSAWLMTLRALEALYPQDLAERGGIRVDFRHDSTSGVTGVIANIVTLVTGATHDTGFKGLAGRFDRLVAGAVGPDLDEAGGPCPQGAAAPAAVPAFLARPGPGSEAEPARHAHRGDRHDRAIADADRLAVDELGAAQALGELGERVGVDAPHRQAAALLAHRAAAPAVIRRTG